MNKFCVYFILFLVVSQSYLINICNAPPPPAVVVQPTTSSSSVVANPSNRNFGSISGGLDCNELLLSSESCRFSLGNKLIDDASRILELEKEYLGFTDFTFSERSALLQAIIEEFSPDGLKRNLSVITDFFCKHEKNIYTEILTDTCLTTVVDKQRIELFGDLISDSFSIEVQNDQEMVPVFKEYIQQLFIDCASDLLEKVSENENADMKDILNKIASNQYIKTYKDLVNIYKNIPVIDLIEPKKDPEIIFKSEKIENMSLDIRKVFKYQTDCDEVIEYFILCSKEKYAKKTLDDRSTAIHKNFYDYHCLHDVETTMINELMENVERIRNEKNRILIMNKSKHLSINFLDFLRNEFHMDKIKPFLELIDKEILEHKEAKGIDKNALEMLSHLCYISIIVNQNIILCRGFFSNNRITEKNYESILKKFKGDLNQLMKNCVSDLLPKTSDNKAIVFADIVSFSLQKAYSLLLNQCSEFFKKTQSNNYNGNQPAEEELIMKWNDLAENKNKPAYLSLFEKLFNLLTETFKFHFDKVISEYEKKINDEENEETRETEPSLLTNEENEETRETEPSLLTNSKSAENRFLNSKSAENRFLRTIKKAIKGLWERLKKFWQTFINYFK